MGTRRSQARKRYLYGQDSSGQPYGLEPVYASLAARTAAEQANGANRATDTAPTVANVIPGQNVTEGLSWSFAFAANTFADAESGSGDTMTYYAYMDNKMPLPAAITFTPATRTFAATKIPGSLVGYTLRIIVRAVDRCGRYVETPLVVTVGANVGPIVAIPLVDQVATHGVAMTPYAFAAGSFTDATGGDAITYTAALSDGSPLPAWLTFVPATRTFSGTPPVVGVTTVVVRATDLALNYISDDFKITAA